MVTKIGIDLGTTCLLYTSGFFCGWKGRIYTGMGDSQCTEKWNGADTFDIASTTGKQSYGMS